MRLRGRKMAYPEIMQALPIGGVSCRRIDPHAISLDIPQGGNQSVFLHLDESRTGENPMSPVEVDRGRNLPHIRVDDQNLSR